MNRAFPCYIVYYVGKARFLFNEDFHNSNVFLAVSVCATILLKLKPIIIRNVQFFINPNLPSSESHIDYQITLKFHQVEGYIGGFTVSFHKSRFFFKKRSIRFNLTRTVDTLVLRFTLKSWKRNWRVGI